MEGGSRITLGNGRVIEVISIDEAINEEVCLVKMDIEDTERMEDVKYEAGQ